MTIAASQTTVTGSLSASALTKQLSTTVPQKGERTLTYVPIIISALSLILAVYTFLSKNSKENTTELTTVIVSLDNIKTGIADIKAELNSIKSSQKEDHDKLIRVEESLKSAWKQINKIQVGNSMNEEENI